MEVVGVAVVGGVGGARPKYTPEGAASGTLAKASEVGVVGEGAVFEGGSEVWRGDVVVEIAPEENGEVVMSV